MSFAFPVLIEVLAVQWFRRVGYDLCAHGIYRYRRDNVLVKWSLYGEVDYL